MWPARSAEPEASESPSTAPNERADAAADDVVAAPARSPAVFTLGLRKEYRRTVALEGLSMSVQRGEIFGFLGPNGAGKTTAVKLLLGLVRPSGGEAMVLGAPAGDVETRRRIGYLPELFRFQGWLTAEEVLMLHCRLAAIAPARRRQLVGEALETVGLAERAGDKVGGFSKGMQQRLGLSVALLGQPELVVLDEPTSALDPVGRHDVREIVRGVRARGATVFLNTHLLEEVEHVCDRAAVIDKGRAVVTGTIAEIVGGQPQVRLRVTGLDGEWWKTFARFGEWSRDGEWLVVSGIQDGQIPDLVAAVVAEGGRVGAVVPEHKSLEDRFLELLARP